MNNLSLSITEPPNNTIEINTSTQPDSISILTVQPESYILELNSDIASFSVDSSEFVKTIVSNFLQEGSGIFFSSLEDQLQINSFNLNAGSGLSIEYNESNNLWNISISGVAVDQHTHVAADILDFSTAVDSLINVKDIVGGSGISVTSTSGIYNVAFTGALGDVSEEDIDNRILEFLSSGSYVSLTYDNINDTLIISATGVQPSGNYSVVGHTHTSSEITNFNSSVSGILSNSPALSGTPTTPTAPSGTNNNQIANTAFVVTAIDGKVSKSGDTMTGNLVCPTGLFTGLKVNNIDVSVSGHTHTASEISNLTPTISGTIDSLITSRVSGINGIEIEYNSVQDIVYISSSGLSIVGHGHTASEITDLNNVRLSFFSSPNASINFNNQRITNLASPAAGTDAINRNYIETLLASTTSLGIASFNSGNFIVSTGEVSIKNSGVPNSALVYDYINLGLSTLVLGSTVMSVSGLILDGGSP